MGKYWWRWRITSREHRGERGLTLIELIVAFTILSVLATMAVPLARYRIRHERERDLVFALQEIRKAIDNYKDMADRGQLGPIKIGTDGYPESLEVLVEGVKKAGAVDAKIRFLRGSKGSHDQFLRLGQA